MTDIDPLPNDPAFATALRQRGVRFHFVKPELLNYLSVAVAEGLEALGIPFHANMSCGPRRGPGTELLFQPPPPGHPGPALIVADISDVTEDIPGHQALIQQIAGQRLGGGPPAVLLCMSDSSADFDFPDFLPVFITHELDRLKAGGQRIPWAFGLTRNVLSMIEASPPVAARKRKFLRNFRPSVNQPVRQALDLTFVEPLQRKWVIDRTMEGGGRFKDGYYVRLKGAFGCLAYGGTFAEDLTRNDFIRERGMAQRVLGETPVIMRWDSWRLWESLAAGCLTVTLDFAAYGMKLPIAPQHGVHYVGLRFDALAEGLALLNAGDEALAKIAAAGQAFALEHYAPLPVARRFLNEVSRLFAGAWG